MNKILKGPASDLFLLKNSVAIQFFQETFILLPLSPNILPIKKKLKSVILIFPLSERLK